MFTYSFIKHPCPKGPPAHGEPGHHTTLIFKASGRWNPPWCIFSLKMTSNPGFIDVPENSIGDPPYSQEYDYLWTEETNSVKEGNGILEPSHWIHDAVDRQGGVEGTNPLAVGLLVGIAYSGLLLVGSMLNLPKSPKLENDEMCGITTGGQVRHSE